MQPMTHSFFRIGKVLVVLALGHLSGTPAAGENPFFRRATEKPPDEACLTMFLESSSESLATTMAVSNRCNFPVALLTSPLEVRVRTTGKEKLVNERLSRGAAYAILYVVAADLGDQGFEGDGAVRDGGLQVLRPPGYTTIPAMGENIRVPVKCAIALPTGRYFMPMMTYESPQGDAPARHDPFDCSESVEHFNEGSQNPASISLGSDARQVSSRSVAIDLRSK